MPAIATGPINMEKKKKKKKGKKVTLADRQGTA